MFQIVPKNPILTLDVGQHTDALIIFIIGHYLYALVLSVYDHKKYLQPTSVLMPSETTTVNKWSKCNFSHLYLVEKLLHYILCDIYEMFTNNKCY